MSPVSDNNTTLDDGSISWMLTATALVLSMSPALAMFEAGMLRSKNTLSLFTQIFSGMIVLSMLWMFVGYSLTFGASVGGVIGNPIQHIFWADLPYDQPSVHAPQIPAALFALFQMMFAVITPLLITGAYAERMPFRVFILFSVIWSLLVYYPIAHSIWGGGLMARLGVLDFAGGITIHTTAGTASIVSAIMIGQRHEFAEYHGDFPPSSLPLAATGAALLWVGWFGFNGGSALMSGATAVSACVSSQMGAVSCGFVWLLCSWYRGKPSTSALLNGCIAGLAGITPASGYINSPASLLLGLILGIFSYAGVYVLKHILVIDDALDVSCVHGVTGILGALYLGLFAQQSLNPGGSNGAIYGNPALFGYQCVAVAITIVYTALMTSVILALIRCVVPIRLDELSESVGADYAEHGEIAYHKLHVLEQSQRNSEKYAHFAESEREKREQAREEAESTMSDHPAISPRNGHERQQQKHHSYLIPQEEEAPQQNSAHGSLNRSSRSALLPPHSPPPVHSAANNSPSSSTRRLVITLPSNDTYRRVSPSIL